MPNDIPERQNETHLLQRLLAVNELYYRAKRAQDLQVILTAILPIGLVFLAVLSDRLEPWVALAGLALALLDVAVLDPRQASLRHRASAVRDAFDRELFGDVSHDVIAREGIHEEEVINAAEAAKRRGKSEVQVRNWYPISVGVLPRPVARLLCLRANLVWDERLRRKFAGGLGAITAILLGGSVAAGLLLNLDLRTLILAVLVPLSPAALWSLREWLRQRDAIASTAALNGRVMTVVERAARGDASLAQVDEETRSLQWQMAEWRQNMPPLPEWLYARSRDRHEEEMQSATTTWVDRMRRRFPS